MRIAYLYAETTHPVPGSTGASVHALELARAFAADGHRVDILAAVRGRAVAAPDGVRVVELLGRHSIRARLAAIKLRRSPPPSSPLFDPDAPAMISAAPTVWVRDVARIVIAWIDNELLFRRALRRLARQRPDLIYERHVRLSRTGVRLARSLGVPLIVEMNASFVSPTEWWGIHSPLWPRYLAAVEKRVVEHATAVVAVSAALRDHCRAIAPRPGRVVLMPNAADTDRFRPNNWAGARVRELLGLADEVVVGFIGSMRPWHGADALLEAARTVVREAPHTRFMLVGDGPMRADLEARAERLALQNHVRFTGHVPWSDVHAYVAAMDIATAPYPVLESFHFSPLKVFECMASAKPVVASAYPDIAAVIVHGDNGLLVEPGDVGALSDALLLLVTDQDRREQMGDAARKTIVQRHTWAINARTVVALASVLADSARDAPGVPTGAS